MPNSAIVSPCGTYRYRLDRFVQMFGRVYAFFGVNPSTADAWTEDATTRKWAGFCLRNDARSYIAGNAFAYRSTEVRALAGAADPVGPDNAAHLRQIIMDADVLVPCWGAREKLPRHLRCHLDELLALLLDSGKPVLTFGFTSSGDPGHPQCLPYTTPLRPIPQRHG